MAHEHSCSFGRRAGGRLRAARAWLFAQSTTPAQTRRWLRDRSADDRCEKAGELAFGDPGLVQS